MDPAHDTGSPRESTRACGNFATTQWSDVIAVSGGDSQRANVALETLCRRYWHPIYAFIRRRGANPHEAEDLTQAFFVQLLETDALKRADRQKGKFRTFLLASLTHFLANEWDKRHALKRGGAHKFISLDDAGAANLYSRESVDAITPEKLFERSWAILLMESALARLKQEYAAGDKAELFATLEPGLAAEPATGWHASLASGLRINEGAARVALHRFRRRFGELLRVEIAQTVAAPSEIDEELRCLFSAITT